MSSGIKRRLSTRLLALAGTEAPSLAPIPGPTAFPLIGSLPYYLPIPGLQKYDPKRLYPSSLKKVQEYGPIFKETLFGETLLFLADPDDYQTLYHTRSTDPWPLRRSHAVMEYVRKHELKKWHDNGGIFTENDKVWADIRHRYQKSVLVSDEIARFTKKTDEIACSLIEPIRSDPYMKSLIETDYLNVIFSYATDYMGHILFGRNWNSVDSILDKGSIANRVIHASTEMNELTGPTDHGAGLWRYFATPAYKTILNCAETLDKVAVEELDARVQGNQILPLKDPSDNLLDTWIARGNRDYKDLVTFIADMLLAGTDTTSYSLSFVLYNLSVNRDAQDKLYQELKKLAPSPSAPITNEQISDASYLKKCIKESLRLNPLAIGIGRVLQENTVLSGYLVPEGTQIVTMNQVTSRLPKYVDFPHHFIPERFENDGKFRRLHPYIVLPFSHGPRSCVGRRLAEQAMNIFTFRLFRNYSLEWIGPKPLDAVTAIINKPDAPLLFKFTPRRL